MPPQPMIPILTSFKFIPQDHIHSDQAFHMFPLIFSGGNLHFTIKEENDIVNRDKITIGFTKNVYYTFQSKRSGIDQEPGSQPDTDSYTNIRLQICCFIKKKFTGKK